MSFFSSLKEKLGDEDFRRNLKRVFVGAAVVGAGLYVYRKGYRNGEARGFVAGYGEARTEEALALEEHEDT